MIWSSSAGTGQIKPRNGKASGGGDLGPLEDTGFLEMELQEWTDIFSKTVNSIFGQDSPKNSPPRDTLIIENLGRQYELIGGRNKTRSVQRTKFTVIDLNTGDTTSVQIKSLY